MVKNILIIISLSLVFSCNLNQSNKNSTKQDKTKLVIIGLYNFIQSLNIPECSQVGLNYSTEKSQIPTTITWSAIGTAKEIINQQEKLVVISGGSNPIPLATWDSFQPSFPYAKNIDRYLLFQKTFLYRSPNTKVSCTGNDCITQREYKGYTWIELAKSVCVSYIGGKSGNILLPDKGRLVVKPIQKCQILYFQDSIYQLTDNQGNYYVMHAYNSGSPDTTVVLPSGWSLKQITLSAPLTISPFGGGDNCYYNIVGDNLGQGYHQYIYADKTYSSK